MRDHCLYSLVIYLFTKEGMLRVEPKRELGKSCVALCVISR